VRPGPRLDMPARAQPHADPPRRVAGWLRLARFVAWRCLAASLGIKNRIIVGSHAHIARGINCQLICLVAWTRWRLRHWRRRGHLRRRPVPVRRKSRSPTIQLACTCIGGYIWQLAVMQLPRFQGLRFGSSERLYSGWCAGLLAFLP
jgi:hypothetical protein